MDGPGKYDEADAHEQTGYRPSPQHLHEHASKPRRCVESCKSGFTIFPPTTAIAGSDVLHDAKRKGWCDIANHMRAQTVPSKAPPEMIRNAGVHHVQDDHDDPHRHDDAEAPNLWRFGNAKPNHESRHDKVRIAEDKMRAVKMPPLAALERAIRAVLPRQTHAAQAVLAARDEAEHGGDDGEHGAGSHVGQPRDGEVEDYGDQSAFCENEEPESRDGELVLS